MVINISLDKTKPNCLWSWWFCPFRALSQEKSIDFCPGALHQESKWVADVFLSLSGKRTSMGEVGKENLQSTGAFSVGSILGKSKE